MTFFKEKNNNRGRIVLEGALTLDHIRKLRDELRSSLEKVKHLEVDVAGAGETDLAFLQLLCSAHRTAAKMGKTLSLIEELPEVFLRAAEDNGYFRPSGCSLEINKTCLWRKREKGK